MKFFNKLFDWYLNKRALPYWGVLFLDILAAYAAAAVAYAAINGVLDLAHNIVPAMRTMGLYMIVFCITGKIFHVYNINLRHSTFVDLQNVALSMFCGASIVFVARHYIPLDTWLWPISGKVVLLGATLATLLIMLIRIVMKGIYDRRGISSHTPHAMIYGAHENSEHLAQVIQSRGRYSYKVCGFITGDKKFANKYINGIKVYMKDDLTIEKMKEEEIEAVICDEHNSARIHQERDLTFRLINAGIKILVTAPVEKLSKSIRIKEVDIEDLLPREQIEIDLDAIGELLTDKTILITGAAGSIGSELVRQIAVYQPKMMVLIDQAETPMHAMMLELQKSWPEQKFIPLVSSITKTRQMESFFKDYRPDFVFHAAAYKHVPMMEISPANAVQNNCIGTRVIADLAVKYGVKKFVMISTDKAVNPTNVMGCSKRICEIYCQALNKEQTATEFITTRFGNVLGSNGSVIPIFREQIQNGGPVTVTHPEIVRYFMLISEACKLVLQAGTMGHGGEIYAFDMGEAVRIADLAQRMIDLSGARDVKIEYTGLRDGEKLYEEVINEEENTLPTSHPKNRVAKVREYAYEEVLRNEQDLEALSYTYDEMAIVRKMKEIVPEYKSQHSRFEALDLP